MKRGRLPLAIVMGCLLLLGASAATRAEPSETAENEPPAPLILAIGDSLTAGYGLDRDAAFPTMLEAALRGAGIEARVLNAGVSGDTSSGGRARLDWALAGAAESAPEHRALDLVVLEFGANDALRGVDPSVTRENLDAMLRLLMGRDVTTLLVGMLAPPNLGPVYGERFNSIYPDLAAKYGVAFYPFFLDGVAATPRLNQQDGIHPNAEGVRLIVERMLPYVIDALDKEASTARLDGREHD